MRHATHRTRGRAHKAFFGLLATQFAILRLAHGQTEPRAPVVTAPAASNATEEPSLGAARPTEATDDEPEFEGVAEITAPATESTKRTLQREALTVVPGTRGDALRAIEIMPGVARTPFGTNPGPPLLRGSPSSESLVLLDGAQVPLLYHFGGLTSFYNSQLIESVTLYPGNYSARYGRAAGGAVSAKVRDPKSDRWHLLLEIGAIDSFALAEGPVSTDTSIALAVRRSNVDLFIDALITDDSTAVVAAPVYWDYQAIVSHHLSDHHELRVLGYGSGDALELHFGEAVANDPALQGKFGSTTSFHRLQVELESQLSEKVEQELMLSIGPSPGDGQLGNVEFNYTTWDLNARADWSIFAAPWLRLDTGIDAVFLDVDFRYFGPTPAPTEGVPNQGALASEHQSLTEDEIRALRPGAYVEASLQPVPSLLLIPGVRVDYYADFNRWSVDPRLGTRVSLNPTTTLKAGAGYYSMPPQYWEVMTDFGNPDARPFRTLQTSTGIEQSMGEHVLFDVEGFYKNWDDLVVGTPGGAPPRYVNGGSGDAYGLEFLLNLRSAGKTGAILSYTLSRSTREDRDLPTRLFDRDQTHNVSLTANYDLGGGWQAGARFRYVTGNPYSAVEASVYDASSDTYRPVYGGINEARSAAFHQLDVRLEKLWRTAPANLTTYLEIMNAYNAENEEGRRYSFDYSESASVAGMPFFPNLGIRGEL